MGYTEIKLPKFDVNETKATITEIRVKNKDFVTESDLLIIAEDTKAINEIVSPRKGYILIQCKEFEEKNVGDIIGVVFDSIEELENYHVNETKITPESDTSIDINATKKAIILAQKLGINLNFVAKLHPGEVIKEKNVQDYFNNKEKNVISTIASKHVFKYDRERVVVIGAGKGAEVLIDILLDDYEKVIVGLVDDNVKFFENYEFPILNCGVFDFPDSIDCGIYDTVILSMSANLKMMKLRNKIYKDYRSKGIEFTNAIARSAEIRRGVKLGKGNIIGAGCYIGTLTEIGNNNQISYSVNIGHHNLIGDCNLFAPGVFTSGSVNIGSRCIIPAGVSMINRVILGDEVILPVGYSVVNSIESGRVIKQKTTM